MILGKLRISIVSVTLVLSSMDVALSTGIASEGEKIAVQWCASCHIVSEDQETALADAPSFKHIASRYESRLAAFGAYLADPHPAMPNLSLTRSEIQDLLAYIGSLK